MKVVQSEEMKMNYPLDCKETFDFCLLWRADHVIRKVWMNIRCTVLAPCSQVTLCTDPLPRMMGKGY